eukprot:5207850-Alexandrium_andersonii.AAC.2
MPGWRCCLGEGRGREAARSVELRLALDPPWGVLKVYQGGVAQGLHPRIAEPWRRGLEHKEAAVAIIALLSWVAGTSQLRCAYRGSMPQIASWKLELRGPRNGFAVRT